MSDLENTKQIIQKKLAEILPQIEVISSDRGNAAKITIRSESISLPIVSNSIISSFTKVR